MANTLKNLQVVIDDFNAEYVLVKAKYDIANNDVRAASDRRSKWAEQKSRLENSISALLDVMADQVP